MFRLTYSIPYEGDRAMDFNTLDEVAHWIEENPSSYDHNYDNLEIIEIAREISVSELMAERRAASKP